jgi:hypothetical protein
MTDTAILDWLEEEVIAVNCHPYGWNFLLAGADGEPMGEERLVEGDDFRAACIEAQRIQNELLGVVPGRKEKRAKASGFLRVPEEWTKVPAWINAASVAYVCQDDMNSGCAVYIHGAYVVHVTCTAAEFVAWLERGGE